MRCACLRTVRLRSGNRFFARLHRGVIDRKNNPKSCRLLACYKSPSAPRDANAIDIRGGDATAAQDETAATIAILAPLARVADHVHEAQPIGPGSKLLDGDGAAFAALEMFAREDPAAIAARFRITPWLRKTFVVGATRRALPLDFRWQLTANPRAKCLRLFY